MDDLYPVLDFLGKVFCAMERVRQVLIIEGKGWDLLFPVLSR